MSGFDMLHGKALIRHSTGFICIALVPASVLIFNAITKISANFNTQLWKNLCVLTVFFTLLFMGTRTYSYLFGRKGIGPYSALVDQHELANWINQNGKIERPLPIVNCDPLLSNDLFDSHIVYPQGVLSSGLFRKVSCNTELIPNLIKEGPIVVLDLDASLPKSNLKLLAGSRTHQGLWSAL